MTSGEQTIKLPLKPDWRTMTDLERYKCIDDLVIEHSRFRALIKEIDYCDMYACHIASGTPPCIAILGETGAGKTTLIETWLKNASARRIETPEGSIIPYLYVSVPAKATIKGTASAFLTTLGDPNPSRGTQWNMVNRLHAIIQGCQVRIIFVDEFQHLISKETQRILNDVADFLKDIINQTNVSMALIGRVGEAEPILQVNPQLDRRVGSPLYLEPFAWDRNNPKETIKEFCALLYMLDQSLPFEPCGLHEEQMAYRIFYATNGYLGWIMHLLRRAAYEAIQANCQSLHLAFLEQAYTSRIAGTEMGTKKVNPFSSKKDFLNEIVPFVPLPRHTVLQTKNPRERK